MDAKERKRIVSATKRMGDRALSSVIGIPKSSVGGRGECDESDGRPVGRYSALVSGDAALKVRDIIQQESPIIESALSAVGFMTVRITKGEDDIFTGTPTYSISATIDAEAIGAGSGQGERNRKVEGYIKSTASEHLGKEAEVVVDIEGARGTRMVEIDVRGDVGVDGFSEWASRMFSMTPTAHSSNDSTSAFYKERQFFFSMEKEAFEYIASEGDKNESNKTKHTMNRKIYEAKMDLVDARKEYKDAFRKYQELKETETPDGRNVVRTNDDVDRYQDNQSSNSYSNYDSRQEDVTKKYEKVAKVIEDYVFSSFCRMGSKYDKDDFSAYRDMNVDDEGNVIIDLTWVKHKGPIDPEDMRNLAAAIEGAGIKVGMKPYLTKVDSGTFDIPNAPDDITITFYTKVNEINTKITGDKTTMTYGRGDDYWTKPNYDKNGPAPKMRKPYDFEN